MRVMQVASRSTGIVTRLSIFVAALVLGLSPHIAAAQSHVAVVHLDPASYKPESYDARAAVAQSFYAAHGDEYDFLIAFPIFQVDRSAAIASAETEGRHFMVRNTVSGTGLPLSEMGLDFGSQARLKGFIDEYALVPGDDQTFDAALEVIAHEVAHQWSGAARYLDRRTGQVSDALLGLEGGHWSYFLDSDASVLYGADWIAASAGKYSASATLKRYSSLDLYLMGFIGQDELEPFTLLQPSPTVTTPSASLPPAVGTQIAATPLTVTGADLVAAMGPRVPASSAAPASFRAAFVVVAPPGANPTADQLAFVESLRVEWANRFFYMTRGRAVMQTELVERPPAALAASPSVQLGVDYLLAHQAVDGSWSDSPGTTVRETEGALEALRLVGAAPVIQAAIGRGASYAGALQPVDVDSSARQLLALLAAYAPPLGGSPAPRDLSNANPDGGMALTPGYGSTVIDTVLAALTAPEGPALDAALAFLRAAQRTDGGWGMLAGGPSDISTTSLVLELMTRAPRSDENMIAVRAALDCLERHRQPGGSYLDDDTQESRTAEAILALLAWNQLTSEEVAASTELLLGQQQGDGSWGGSVEETAQTIRALRILMLPNLSISPSDVTVYATSATVGEQGWAQAVVHNTGYADARNVTVQAFDADGKAFGPPSILPLVRAGQIATAALSIDTTGHGGTTQLFVVVDPGGTIEETDREDDRVATAFAVKPRPVLPDLYVASGSVAANPASTARMGIPITVTARVGNLGATDVPSTALTLRSGSTLLASTTLALPAGSARDITLTGTLVTGASPVLTVAIDPDGLIAEDREDNNTGSITVRLDAGVDLTTHLVSVTPSPVDPGRDVTVAYALSNAGTSTAQPTATTVSFLDANGQVLATVPGATLSIPSGGTVSGSATWRVSTTRAVSIRVDAPYPSDLNPADNTATGPIAVRESGLPNIAFDGSPSIDPDPPLEAKPATVNARVRNTSQFRAGPSALELWLGDPQSGGKRASRVELPAMEGGTSSPVAVPLPASPATPTLLVLKLDPDNAVEEFDETDNTAVLTIQPLTIPDLSVSDGDIRPSNLYPRAGEHVTVTVEVANLGGQDAGPTLVQLFQNAPEARGALLGATTVSSVPANGRTQATFAWDTTGLSGSVSLVAVVNPGHAVAESRYDNDRAVRQAMIQSGAVALSEPYFSPNGDGVKDETVIYYQLQEPSATKATITDHLGRVVRTLSGSSSVLTGALTWDGLNDSGKLVRDGTYHVMVDAGGSTIGQADAVVDTNRSGVLDVDRDLLAPVAVEDGVRRVMQPKDYPYEITPAGATPDEQALIVHYATMGYTNWGWNTVYRDCGFFLVPVDGGDPVRLSPPGWNSDVNGALTGDCLVRTAYVTPDGSGIVYTSESPDGLWAYGLPPPALKLFDIPSQTVTVLAQNIGHLVALAPDGRTVLFNDQAGLESISLDGSNRRVIRQLPYSAQISPDLSLLAYGIELACDGSVDQNCPARDLRIANLDGSGERVLATTKPGPVCSQKEWVPTGGDGGYYRCVRYDSATRPTPPGAIVLPEGVSLVGSPKWLSGSQLAYRASNGLWVLDVLSGEAARVAGSDSPDWMDGDPMLDPGGEHLVFLWQVPLPQIWTVDSWETQEPTQFYDLSTLNVMSVRSLDFSRAGTFLYAGVDDLAIPQQEHRGYNSYFRIISHLGNLSAQLSGQHRSDSASIAFLGTAEDINFESWELTARPVRGGSPSFVVARGSRPVIDGRFGEWTPPQAGTWQGDLTVTDKAGNRRTVSTVVGWSDVPVIANVRAQPPYFSPNGDGQLDAETISYLAGGPVSTGLVVTNEAGAKVRSIPMTVQEEGNGTIVWDGTTDQGATAPDGRYGLTLGDQHQEVVLDNTPPHVELVGLSGNGGGGNVFTTTAYGTSGYYAAFLPVVAGTCDGGASSPIPRTAIQRMGFGNPYPNIAETLLSFQFVPGAVDPRVFSNSGKVPAVAYRTYGIATDANLSGWSLDTRGSDGVLRPLLLGYATPPYSWDIPVRSSPGFGLRLQALDAAANQSASRVLELPERAFISAWGPGQFADECPGTIEVEDATGFLRLPAALAYLAPTVAATVAVVEMPFLFEPGYHAFMVEHTIKQPIATAAVAYRLHGGASGWIVDQAHVRWSAQGLVTWDARSVPAEYYDIEVRLFDATGRVFSAPIAVAPLHSHTAFDKAYCALPNNSVARVETTGLASDTDVPFYLRDESTGVVTPLEMVLEDEKLTEQVSASGTFDTWAQRTYQPKDDLRQLPGCAYSIILPEGTVEGAGGSNDGVVYSFDICRLELAHQDPPQPKEQVTLSLRETYKKAVSRVDFFWVDPCTTCRDAHPGDWTIQCDRQCKQYSGGPVLAQSVAGFDGLSAPVVITRPSLPWNPECTKAADGTRSLSVPLIADVSFVDGTHQRGPIFGDDVKSCQGIDLSWKCDSQDPVIVHSRIAVNELSSPVCAGRPSDYLITAAVDQSGFATPFVDLRLQAARGSSRPMDLSHDPFAPGDHVSASIKIVSSQYAEGTWTVWGNFIREDSSIFGVGNPPGSKPDVPGGIASFVVERSAPDLYLASPAPHAVVCPMEVRDAMGRTRKLIPVDGTTYDRLGAAPTFLFRCGGPTFSQLQPVMDTGTLGGIDVTGRPSGDCELRLEVRNAGGGSWCTDAVPFHVVNGPGVGALLTRQLFSPNGDGVQDDTSLKVITQEPSSVMITATDQAGRSGIVWQGPLPADTTVIPWDGTIDGSTAADGDVTLSVEATDTCHSTARTTATATIDTTPPTVRIDDPTPATRIGGLVMVTGEASDDHFEHYELDIGAGTNPASYQAVVLSEDPGAGSLGAIPASGLSPGTYTIRLSAWDTVGNKSATSVAVEVSPKQVINLLSVSPDLISPNGDGVLDSAIVRFELLADANTKLEVIDASGAVVSTVLPPIPVFAGDSELSLSASALAGVLDGDYRVRLSVAAGDLIEQETAPLVLDRVKPKIALQSPANGAVEPGSVDVVGAIDDSHLSSWSVHLAASGSAGQTISSGKGRVSGVLATFRDLAEGDYTLDVDAIDGAGNPEHVGRRISSDTTPPAVAFTTPPAGAHVSGVDGRFHVLAEATDAHLASVVLEVSTDGTTWRQVSTGATIGADGLAWDVAAEPDGPAQLRLTAVDAAGNHSDALRAVVVDNTAPVAAIVSPRNTYLKAGDAFTGKASDANLATWSLELTSGVPSAASLWAPLASGTSSIEGGVLTELASLPRDGAYGLRLTVTDLAGNTSRDTASFVVDTKPPAPPTNLAATAAGAAVVLSWSASPDQDVVAYQVLRATGPTGFVPIGSPVQALTYADTGLADASYRYEVVAVDGAGLSSVPSSSVSISIDQSPPVASISSPGTGAAVSGLVQILGTAWSADDFKEYRLSVGSGATPTSFTLVRRSKISVRAAALGQIDTTSWLDGSLLTVRLEAEDLAGNIAEADCPLIVDGTPPAAPVLLSATPNGSNVALAWGPVGDGDLAGYILYRNGSIVNAPASASTADLTRYLLSPASVSYLDASLGDGAYTYELQAYDRAGNGSALSNPLTVTLEAHTPRAIITSPVNLARIAAPTQVVASTTDHDIASIQFTVRDMNGSWQPLGGLLTHTPYTVELDPAAFTGPVFELKAVATDSSGHTDPNVDSVFVFRAAAPAAPTVTARAVQDRVTLTWTDPNPAGSVSGFLATRDRTYLGTTPAMPHGTSSASDTSISPNLGADGSSYTSWSSRKTGAQWWQLDLARPVVAQTVSLALLQPSQLKLSVRVRGVWVSIHSGSDSGSVSVPLDPGLEIDGARVDFLTAPNGSVGLYELSISPMSLVPASPLYDGPLAPGAYSYEIAAVTPFGLAASASTRSSIYAPVLDQPAEVVSTSPLTLTGSQAAPGAAVAIRADDAVAAETTADADGRYRATVPLAVGQNTFVATATDADGNESLTSAPVSLTFDPAPAAHLSLALVGVSGSSVTLRTSVTGDTSGIAGFHLTRAAGSASALVQTLDPAVRTAVDGPLANGTYVYTLTAFNSHGVEGAPSNPVTATVSVPLVAAPSGLVVSPASGGGALQLGWSYAGPAVQGFVVERAASASGPFVSMNGSVAERAYVDRGLASGVPYYYRVRGVDAVGNVGPPSNVASGVPLDTMAPEQPRLVAPTVPALPITVSTAFVDVQGLAGSGDTVELRQDGVWLRTVQAGPLQLSSMVVGSAAWSGGFGVSSDGLTLALGQGNGSQEWLQISGPGSSATIFDPSLSQLGKVVFSADGAWLAFEALSQDDFQQHVYVASTSGEGLQRVSSGGIEDSPVWSPDSVHLAYEAQRDGFAEEVIGIYDVRAMTEAIFEKAGASLWTPAWKPDGTVLAVSETDDGTDAITSFDPGGSEQPPLYSSAVELFDLVVSPRGDLAAFVIGTDEPDVVILDLATGRATRLTSDPDQDRSPAFAKGGRELAWIRGSDLVTEDLASLTLQDLGSVSASRLVGTDLGPLGFSWGGDAVQYDWGGAFTFDHIQLKTGDNEFTAIATDAAGKRSPTSQPISVTLTPGAVADLAVDATLQPAFPLVGESASALVTVRNLGGVSSVATSLQVSIVTSSGSLRTTAPVSIGALPAGGSVVAMVPVDLTGLVGSQKLLSMVDPAGLVVDGDRSNNVSTIAFEVVATRDLSFDLTVTPPAVEVAGTLTANVTVQNPGPAVDASVLVRLADLGGASVYEAPLRAYHPLPGGATTELLVTLPVGLAIAGDYQVVAQLTSAAGKQTVSQPVSVLPERAAAVRVEADRFQYAPGMDVELVSTITNASRNAPLTGATDRTVVKDELGEMVWASDVATLPDIWMGGATSVVATIPAGTLGAGTYTVNAAAEVNSVSIAEGETTFSIAASPLLVGSLAVEGQGDPTIVPAGTAAAVDVTLRNAGTVTTAPASARIVLLAPQTGAVLSSWDVGAPALAPGGSATQVVSVPTTGLDRATYGLALVVTDAQGHPSTLATAHFRVADGTAPTLALQSPAQGAVVPGVVYPWIHAQDGDTGVALVRAGVGSAMTLLSLSNGNTFDGTWTAPVPLGPDGTYTLLFTAADGDGNDGLTSPTATNPIILTVVSDTIPPTLHVDGVAYGAVVSTPVALNVSATDLHLAGVTAEIDGLAYQPGTLYTVEGTHVFTATAVDLAGNASREMLVFDLDTTPPDVTIAGVTDGQYLAAAVTPVVLVSDWHDTTSTTTLDGTPWLGGEIGSEGRHVLAVDARDAAGNTRHAEVGFWVDLTPPALQISGVQAGVCYARPVTPVLTASDTNLGAVTSTLDGQPFSSGSTVAQEGAHIVAAVARDMAGHETTAQVSFSVDTTPPVITMPAVDGRYFAAPVTLAYSVSDTTATAVDATLDGVAFASGGQVSPEGRHVLEVSAQDCAGNRSTRTATFVVDRTPPTLVLSGVIDGSVVGAPVSIVADANDTNLASVVLELDAAPYVAGTPIVTRGAHVVTGVATDLAMNTAHASLGFTIDNAAPRITVDGVADGDILGRPVTPIVSVTDDDLAGWEMTVDGVVLLPGATITAEGTHKLVVTAHDLAGNPANLTLGFTIDLTPPAIDVGGVAGGMCYAHDVTPTYAARDANLASVDGTLDGKTFASGTVVSVEGDHSLTVMARDRAEHVIASTTGFVVDKTAPTVTISNLDGRYFAGPVTPSYTVSDPHLVTTAVTLDGAPLAAGDSISAEGAHILAVTAQDCAGNSKTQSASFTIDMTPPTLELSGVAERAVVKGPVRVTYIVTDRTPATVVLTLDGGAYTSGAAISAVGAHTVVAVATDAAGNAFRATRSFTIDDTAPVIQITGVTEGELTHADVVPFITVTDTNLASWTATVDSVELAPGSAITTEGKHKLLVVAQDQAGNEASTTVSFEIDKTPPVISASVTDGAEYAPPLTVTYSATDTHLGPVTATMDGQPFTSGGSVTAAGSHKLVVTADDLAGNEAVRSYSFSLTGQGRKYQVEKKLVLGDLRVLARVACGKVGDGSAAFLARALQGAKIKVVRNDMDLLVGLRSGLYDLVVVTDQVSGRVASSSGSQVVSSSAGSSGDAVAITGAMANCMDSCPPTLSPVPPLSACELGKRLPAELTEAVHRGVGLLVFRTAAPWEPWLREALGLQFLGNEGSTTVSLLQTAVSGAMQLKVADGVALKLDAARSIGNFKCGSKVAAAIHGHGLGEVVVFGFDPARASGSAEALVSGAVAFAFTEADPAAGGVVAVRIEVKDEGAAATTRVREHLDPGLAVLEIRNGGVKLPNGDLEWTLNQGAGETDALEYLLELPEVAGTYSTMAEVAQMVAGQAQAVGTYPLSIALQAGAKELQAQAEQLASAIPSQGCNKSLRKAILADLALVRANAGRTASEREAAIAALLDAVDQVKALQGVDGTPLRLAIDSVLAVWEGR